MLIHLHRVGAGPITRRLDQLRKRVGTQEADIGVQDAEEVFLSAPQGGIVICTESQWGLVETQINSKRPGAVLEERSLLGNIDCQNHSGNHPGAQFCNVLQQGMHHLPMAMTDNRDNQGWTIFNTSVHNMNFSWS
ncbi:hypothetical protein D3C78_1101590 [compost metagenome]